MKKAYLVTFEVCTRVVVDVPENFDSDNCNLVIEENAVADETIIQKARENILNDPTNYLNGDNVLYAEDVECPYGIFKDEQ